MPAVLIVDDDKFTRTVLETIFAQDPAFAPLELEVHVAADGEQGLEGYRTHHPDIVVIDLLMPKIDGFALCQAIRAEPGGDATHLVAMSGIYRDTAIANRLRTEYRATFFAKPYQLKEMTRHIAGLLEPGEGRAASPAAEITRAATDSGEIADRPLPAILIDLLENSATGRLHLRRGGVKKTVDLVFGHPANCSTNVRDETLGHFLANRGIIDEAQHVAGVERAARDKQRIGEALIAAGALTPEQLVDQLTAQVRFKIAQTLRWPDGSWQFEPTGSTPSSPVGHPIDTAAMVLTGLRDTASFDAVATRVAAIEAAELDLNPRGQRLLPVVRQQLTPQFADAWQPGTTVEALVAAGVDRDQVNLVLDALLLCDGLVTREAGTVVAISSDADRSRAISVTALAARSQRPTPTGETGETGVELYSMLFEDSVMTPLPTGHDPIDLVDGMPEEETMPIDSGHVEVPGSNAGRDQPALVGGNAARRMLLEEYLRIQGLDHYGVLRVERDATPATISAAVVERRTKFSMNWFARYDLGRDYAKLEQVHAAYDSAFAVLLDERARASYDRDAAGPGDAAPSPPPMEAELAFNEGQELVRKGHPAQAIEKLARAVAVAPDEAAYHAALGWAHFLAGGRNARAADLARPHLTQALVVNPDHADAHEYRGIITAELGNDDVEARAHLERALDAEPSRTAALTALEKVWARSGEMRPLERQYRRLIYRAAGRSPELERNLWVKLAELYRTQLDDPASARVAYQSAARLAPQDPAIQAALADLDSGSADRFYERSEMLRDHWRRDPTARGPGLELLRAAQQSRRPDAEFMAASALVARGLANDEADKIYQRFRPRFVLRAQRQLDPELWQRVRHVDDNSELGALFDLLAPAAAAVHPMTLDDLEVDQSMAIDENRLTPDFVKVRAYVAHMLGVAPPRVYLRADFGHQIHVGAVAPPVLLAGDEALAAPERSELSFRLGRAMTYLAPGRALGGSRPSRFLKRTLLAAFSIASPHAPVADPDGTIAEIQRHITLLPAPVQQQVHALVTHISQRSRSLNLSSWARALARTADRIGLLLCGDLPAAVRFALDSGSDNAGEHLVDFAISSAHLGLRNQLGLSIDV